MKTKAEIHGASEAPTCKPDGYSFGLGDLALYDENGVEIDTTIYGYHRNTHRHGSTSTSWLIPVLLCLSAAT